MVYNDLASEMQNSGKESHQSPEDAPEQQEGAGAHHRDDARSIRTVIPLQEADVPEIPPPIVYHPLSLHVLALLMPFSVLGTLARLGIHALFSYDGESIFPLAWVQAVGCGIMGLAFGLREPISRCYGPLYTAVTTGFCGSLTTFSGWELDVFLAWANASARRRIWIYDVMDGLTRIVFTLAGSFGAFGLGLGAAKKIASRVPVLPHPGLVCRWIITCVSMAVYASTIPIFIRANHAWRPEVTAALVFSVPGTFTRYMLSIYLNPVMVTFPLGTFLANEVATGLLAAFHVIQRTRPCHGTLSCSILQGLMDGYCGCMSTVSTFVVEAHTLKGRKALAYVSLSFVIGQLLVLVIVGSAWWTGTIEETTWTLGS